MLKGLGKRAEELKNERSCRLCQSCKSKNPINGSSDNRKIQTVQDLTIPKNEELDGEKYGGMWISGSQTVLIGAAITKF